MASRIGKVPVKEKIAGGIRKMFTTVAAAGVLVGLPGYHLYGSVEEIEAKVQSYDTNYKWDDGDSTSKYDYKIVTNKGTFADKDSFFHLKGKDETSKIWSDVRIGETYKFKVYGLGIGPLEKNIIGMRLVTEEELKERERLKKQTQEAAKKEAAQMQQQGGAAAPAAGAPATPAAQFQQVAPPALSGRVQTIDIVHGNNVIQLTVPAEVVGKVTINNITPMQIAPAPKAPGG